MLFFVFIILAGYAVRCDNASNNYYVIEMPEDDVPLRETKKPFNVYWNVPTMQCESKKIPFANLYEKYGIIQNANDSFRGEKIAILYDPGLFPALLKNETSGKFKFRNGGVPQEGDIDSHLDAFRLTMEQSIPDVDFKGIGIIDFESWRPIFRQNFGVLIPYKDVSYEIEKKMHWWWPKTWIQEEAKERFEEAARIFMQNTLSIAKQMRPKAQWGYYGFPYCFNVATNNPSENCPAKVTQENNQLHWLWSESTALYPSVYSSKNLTSKQLAALIRGRVAEASRTRRKGTLILPYFWFRYRDGGFFNELDLEMVLKTLYKSNASGFIIWGSSKDVNTIDKCNKLQNYVDTIMGPAIAKYAKYNQKTEDETTTNDSNYITYETVTKEAVYDDQTTVTPENVPNSTSTTHQNLLENNETEIENEKIQSNNIALDPEFHWVPPDTYNQDIKLYVEEELTKKLKNNNITTDIKHKLADSLKGTILIDMIINALYGSKTEIKIAPESNGELKPIENVLNNVDSNLHHINKFTSVSKYPPFEPSTESPIVDANKEIKEGPTLNDIILGGYDRNIYTTGYTVPIAVVENSYKDFNTHDTKNKHVISQNKAKNSSSNDFVDPKTQIELSTSPSVSNVEKTFINAEKKDQTTVLPFNQIEDDYVFFDLKTETDNLSTTTNNVRFYTDDLNLITSISNITTETTTIDRNKQIGISSNSMTEDFYISQYSIYITKESNLTNLTNNSLTEPQTFTERNDKEFVYFHKEGNVDEILSQQTENLSVFTESVNSSTDLDDNATVSPVLEEVLEEIMSLGKNEEVNIDENFTPLGLPSTSSPDKVATSNIANGAKDLMYTYYMFIMYLKMLM
ncbi:unnamed protein product [Parnassius apollo]|uniref:Hyaluronidase n=1 Tax=Parnassius apollo TaxID=110799 RepID=A0A8S3X7J2_PARAO|nr:unnamed protein product [Parnassius apollo]